MLLKKQKLYREEQGTAVVLFALSIAIIFGMAGLVIDVGILYQTKSELKKTSNAAVLSGAQELTNGNNLVNNIVMEILKANKEEGNLKEINIQTNNVNQLKVVLEKDVPLYFLKIFKMNSIKVTESSTAKLVPINRAAGAVPLGIDKSVPLVYLKEYILKVDSGDSAYGNFGILALSGPGAKLYEQDLMYGFDGDIKVGDIIDTQTGNISGKTESAVNYRINLCPYPVNDISHRDNSRIILVLVYEPYNVQSNQMKQVKVTGFAYFYIKSPVDKHDSTITGYFIKRAGGGSGDINGADKGAYAIKLTQ